MKAKTEIEVSIIIPTFNRKDSLIKTLISLESQSFPREKMEVIVVDDGSTDGTLQLLNSKSPQFSYSLLIIKSHRIGPGPARNLGLNKASGQIVLFTDSDCEPDHNWITEMVGALDSQTSIICGHVKIQKKYNLLPKCVNFILSTWLGGMGKSWKLFGFIPGLRLRTMNVAFYIDVVKDVGGFINSGYAEDTEFGERLERKGYNLKHCLTGVVYHCENRSILDYTMESLAKGIATVFMIRKDYIRLRGIYILPQALIFSIFWIIIGTFFNSAIATMCSWFIIFYISVIMCYSIRFAVESKCILSIPFLIPVAFLLHCSYAVGFFLGILHFKVPQKGPRGAAFDI